MDISHISKKYTVRRITEKEAEQVYMLEIGNLFSRTIACNKIQNRFRKPLIKKDLNSGNVLPKMFVIFTK